MASPRILLVDDAPEMLATIKRLLRHDFDVVGSAHNGEEALEAVATLDPDLVTLDVSMPLLNGIQVASRLRERRSRTKVVFVTVHEDPDYVEGAFSAGARAYVLKSRIATDLVPAVQEVLQGRVFTSSFKQTEPQYQKHLCDLAARRSAVVAEAN